MFSWFQKLAFKWVNLFRYSEEGNVTERNNASAGDSKAKIEALL